jgi:uncharacterized integral membrane protein
LKWIFINLIKIGYWLKQLTTTKAMRITTMIIILITVLLTIVLMQNTETVKITFLFGTFYVSKLMALLVFGVVGFILGVLVGRPKKARTIGGGYPADEDEDDDNDTLSDEDREYIKHP